jgi:hypothetical protein
LDSQILLDEINLAFGLRRSSIVINDSIELLFLQLGESPKLPIKPNQIIIYQDYLETIPEFYVSIIGNRLGENKTIFARKTKVQIIDRQLFDDFCNQYHYLKTCNCKVRLGLFLGDELVMVAGLSKPRLMYREGKRTKSAELVRSATKHHYTITGGLTKLIKHYTEQYKPDDLVTYIDKDFFDGKSFEKIGFKCYKSLPPITFWLDVETKIRYTMNQLTKNNMIVDKNQILQNYIPIQNSGVMKMVWEVSGKSESIKY